MPIFTQRSPVGIRSLNRTSYIVINDDELLSACIFFNDKVHKLLNNKRYNFRELKFKLSVNIPKSNGGFMIGAVRVTYYYLDLKGTPKKFVTEKYMMTSGEFTILPNNGGIEWNELPYMAPQGYHFIQSSGHCRTLNHVKISPVSMKSRLKEFHERYFQDWKDGSWSNIKEWCVDQDWKKAKDQKKSIHTNFRIKDEHRKEFKAKDQKEPIHTIYGVPFFKFHRECINKDNALRERYFSDVKSYKERIEKDEKVNRWCAAQQLMVAIGDRVAYFKATTTNPSTGQKMYDIYPVIEMCETWFPSAENSYKDRVNPEWQPVSSCPTCEIVLPYLITNCDIDEKWFKNFFDNDLINKFGHQKAMDHYRTGDQLRC